MSLSRLSQTTAWPFVPSGFSLISPEPLLWSAGVNGLKLLIL